eukprot:CAMPEP_0171241120 /NCGR_PEP_ID=MMETSP0790-20130122/44910_1 /TAXON_ID=2925 /ORGANISM="Alexandrium catenella, Strain OF101" /LENGTH=209 /DNA_ID=CAMNT_0011707677 /DNA_START=198 /DNA_END=824 /DNA_ORIENTATION=-
MARVGRSPTAVSPELRLPHSLDELLAVDASLAGPVRLVDHLLKLLVGEVLADFVRKAPQVLEGYGLLLLVGDIEGVRLEDLVPWVSAEDPWTHHGDELVHLDLPAAVLVDLEDHPDELVAGHVVAQLPHHDLELLVADGAGAVRVEEVEGLLQLLLLLLRELPLLLPRGVEAVHGLLRVHDRRAHDDTRARMIGLQLRLSSLHSRAKMA